MASLSKDGAGWRILFVCPTTKKRRTIRTGKCAKKNADTALNMIERLIEAKQHGSPLDGQTVEWLKGIDETLRGRLAKSGLIETAGAARLKAFLDGFIEQRRRRGDVTESTLVVWGHTKRNLIAFFGADRVLQTITPSEADDWTAWLKADQKLAENTIRKRVQFAKRFCRVAEKRGVIDRNPFKELVGTTVPVPERQFFVDRATMDDLFDQCPTIEHRLLLAFARYMGVRVPSEIVPLKWSDVDWEGQRIVITSPKTKRHRGGDKRVCPIFPEVYPFLLSASEAAPDGAVWIFPSVRSAEKNLRKWLERAILKTGRKPWPRLWVNLRASRATELADKYPSHVAAAWLGHTETIANAHYRQVTAEHYERAAGEATGTMPTAAKNLAQNPAHSPHGTVDQASSRNATSPANPKIGEACGVLTTPQVEDRGLEPLTLALRTPRSPN